MFVLWIFFIAEALAIDDNGICTKNQTILEIPGDAVLTLLLDVHFGPYCNASTPKAFQEVAAAFYLTTNLNKNNYVPGISLGLKVIDTCQDFITVYKRSLMLAAELNCGNSYNYSLGILAPESYISILRPLEQFTDLPITYFYYENATKALINIAVDFVSKRFPAIDLLLTESSETLKHFLISTEEAGVCVQSLNHVQELQNKKEALIVIAAGEEFIRSWMGRQVEQEIRTTWIVLPMDDSEIDDILPVGSYLITPEFLFFDEETIDNYDLEIAGAAAVHSPYLLSIGKALIPIVKLLFNLQHRNCQSGTCLLPHFDSKLLERVSNKQVLDALQIPDEQQTIKYAVFHKSEAGVDDMEAIITYDVDVISYHVTTNDTRERLRPCDSKTQCRDCVNFKNFHKILTNLSKANSTVKPVVKGYLKSGVGILVFLVLVACGTIVCLVIGSYILFRFIIDEVLDGNPTLTLLLIFGNITILQSAVPFFLEEEIFGVERLNAIKIFVTTLSIAFVLSLMLSRAFFLALSTGGIFSSHINGYLQGLLGFFMFGVQLGMSVMYLIIGPANSSYALHSPIFIALLSYDLFLLVIFFGVSSFICKIPRNYREGKCFFFTALSLFALWLTWITIFLFIKPTWRDMIISAGLISSGYVIIIAILLPRVYYMITHLDRKKDYRGHIPDGEMAIHTRRSSTRQSRRPFYEYVLPMEGGINTAAIREPSHPNFYGGTSPPQQRSSNTIPSVQSKGFNNYAYQSDMQETENHYIVPRVCVENQRNKKSTKFSDPDYAQPTYTSQASTIYDDDTCIETEIYVDAVRLSPNRIKNPNEIFPSRCSSPRLYQTEATIDEEDEDDDPQATKITRF